MEVRAVGQDVDLSGTTLVVGVLESLEPAPGSGDFIFDFDDLPLEAMGFKGKKGDLAHLPHDHAASLLLVGLGDEIDFETVRSVSGAAVRAATTERVVSLLARVGIEDATRAVVEGSALGGYQFRNYKTEGDALLATSVELVDADDAQLATTLITTAATNLARDWVNTPAKDQSPEAFADSIAQAASDAPVSVEVWDRARIEDEGLGALLGVAAGSERHPRLVILSYEPESAEFHLALVGKGITFDSGGLSIKSAAFMEEMKDDMSGAAIVSAATIAIAKLGLPIRVSCITPLTDNAVGGDATRPGDVLTPVSGPTIEVLNTDAEGRLVLADGLGVARRLEPDLIIDVATLTGAARVALGDKIAAVFGSDSAVANRILDASSRAGEHFWELPIFKDYRKSIDSNIADIKNISGSRYGGAIVAAIFLSEYAGDGPWAHLDIAGPARTRETSGELVKGGSGVGVRTLVEVASGIAESD